MKLTINLKLQPSLEQNGCNMIQRQLKLRLKPSQEQQLNIWLFQLTGVWNWAIRKLELNAKDGIYYTQKAFHNLLADHAQLRSMLAYKCTTSGRQYLEVNPRYSTKTCSACGCLTGPTGYAGLRVRHWVCTACGADHDRDVNAAINTLHAGVGTTLERHRKVAPGIPEL